MVNPEKKLIQEATLLMRQSQGSSFFKDQPLAISAGFGLTDNRSINKTILTFQSFLLNRWENIRRQIWRNGIREGDYLKAATSALWLFVVAVALEETTRRTSKNIIKLVQSIFNEDQPDSDDNSFIKSFVLNELQSIPIVGQIASSMMYSSNPVPIVNAIDDGLNGLRGLFFGKETDTKIKGGLRALGSFGSLRGVGGSSQLFQILQGSVPETEKSTAGDFFRSTKKRQAGDFF